MFKTVIIKAVNIYNFLKNLNVILNNLIILIKNNIKTKK